MKESDIEGLANHDASESCRCIRKGARHVCRSILTSVPHPPVHWAGGRGCLVPLGRNSSASIGSTRAASASRNTRTLAAKTWEAAHGKQLTLERLGSLAELEEEGVGLEC